MLKENPLHSTLTLGRTCVLGPSVIRSNCPSAKLSSGGTVAESKPGRKEDGPEHTEAASTLTSKKLCSTYRLCPLQSCLRNKSFQKAETSLKPTWSTQQYFISKEKKTLMKHHLFLTGYVHLCFNKVTIYVFGPHISVSLSLRYSFQPPGAVKKQ